VKINPEKSTWARNEVQYLGCVYNQKGSQPAPGLVNKILNLPKPSDISQLRRIIGTFNFYRHFICNFSQHALPLLRLLKQDKDFKWTVECDHAFEYLKTKLAEYPILRFPDFSKTFYLETDSSGFALGAQLCQYFEDNKLHPVAYHSRVLSDTETRYSTFEREGLAIVDSCKHFRHLILNHNLVVVTDHAPLKWLMTCDHKSSRLAKFALKLQEYDMKVVYKPGKNNIIPDALSRVRISEEFVGATALCFQHTPDDFDQYRRLQSEDPVWSAIISYLSSGSLPSTLSPTHTHHIKNHACNYSIQNGVLYYTPPDSYRPLLCVPTILQQDLLQTYHSSLFGCHVSRARTQKRLKQKYFWLGMSNATRDFIAACVLCNQRKRPHCNPVYPFNRYRVTDHFRA
jgi:hypothetical protein